MMSHEKLSVDCDHINLTSKRNIINDQGCSVAANRGPSLCWHRQMFKGIPFGDSCYLDDASIQDKNKTWMNLQLAIANSDQL